MTVPLRGNDLFLEHLSAVDLRVQQAQIKRRFRRQFRGLFGLLQRSLQRGDD